MRLAGLDLLRAVAIVWVLFFHGIVLRLGTPLPLVAQTGWMAVDLFFVLSGYLIAWQLFEALTARDGGVGLRMIARTPAPHSATRRRA